MEMNLRVLKAKIRGLEAEGKSIRKRIDASSGMERDSLWRLKRELGYVTRCHLLAYALLREKPYARTEKHSTKLYVLPSHVYDIIIQNVQPWDAPSWSFERVYDLLQREQAETPSPVLKDVPGSTQKEPGFLARVFGCLR